MLEIIRGDASRIDDLRPLWLVLREHHGSVTPEWGALRPAEESWARRRETYVDILAEDGTLFLAVEDGAAVGYALCEREVGGSPTWQWPADFLSIVDMVVLPSHRRQGVGEALLGAVEDEARTRDVAAVDINAAVPNEAARRFYERHGYRVDLVTYRKPSSDRRVGSASGGRRNRAARRRAFFRQGDAVDYREGDAPPFEGRTTAMRSSPGRGILPAGLEPLSCRGSSRLPTWSGSVRYRDASGPPTGPAPPCSSFALRIAARM